MIKQLFLLSSFFVIFTLAQLPSTYPKLDVANKELLKRGLTKENLDKLNKHFRDLDIALAVARVDEARTGKKGLVMAALDKFEEPALKLFGDMDDKQADIFSKYLDQFRENPII